MARLPTEVDVGGLPSGRSGRPVATYDATSAARGLSSFGAGISRLGANLAANEKVAKAERDREAAKRAAELDKQEQFAIQNKFLQFTAEQDKWFEEQQQKAQPGAFGFTEQVAEGYNERAREFMETVPADLKQQYDGKLFGIEATYVSGARKFERQQRENYYGNNLSDGLTVVENKLYENPEGYDAALAEGLQFIDNIPDDAYSPIQKEELRRNWKTKVQKTSLLGMRPEARLGALGAGQENFSYSGGNIPTDGIKGLVAAKAQQYGVPPEVALGIVYIESTFNPNAKAKTSSASGLYQFIRDTGAQYGLENPFDPEANADAGARFTRDNIQGLQKRLGREPTPGEIYLAHFGGFGTALKVAARNPNTPTSEVFSPKAIAANRSILEGKTVGQVREWADRKMAKAMTSAAGVEVTWTPSQGDPRYADMPLSERVTIMDGAYSDISGEIKDRQSAITKSQTAAYEAFDLGIQTGAVKSVQELLDANATGQIDDGQTATLIRSFEAENKSRKEAIDAQAVWQSGGALNPYNSDDKKVANSVYEQTVEDANVVTDKSAAANLGLVYARSGVVPDKAMAQLRQGLASNDPTMIGQSAAIASQLMTINDTYLADANTNGADLRSAAITYRHLTESVGLTPSQAGQRMADMKDEGKKGQRQALVSSDPVKNAMKQIDSNGVSAVVAPSSFGFGGGEPATLGVETAMVEEYKSIFEENVITADGDLELAKKLTDDRIKRFYGTSTLYSQGDTAIVKYPPELTYPPAEDGTHDYIRYQLEQEMRAAGFDFDDVFLDPMDQTEKDIRMGRPPAYKIQYVKDGKIQMLNAEFTADPNGAMPPVEQEGLTIEQAREQFEAPTGPQTRRERRLPENRAAARERFDQRIEDAVDRVRQRREEIIPQLQNNPPEQAPAPEPTEPEPKPLSGAAARKARRDNRSNADKF